WIAFNALLSEVLVVMLAGVPFNSSQTWTAFLVSAYSTMTILGLMVVALLALFWWRRKPELPRMPNTVAAVLSYLCASEMLEDFKELGEGNGVVGQRGGTYSYGLLRG